MNDLMTCMVEIHPKITKSIIEENSFDQLVQEAKDHNFHRNQLGNTMNLREVDGYMPIDLVYSIFMFWISLLLILNRDLILKMKN